jgi:hypothetical protein
MANPYLEHSIVVAASPEAVYDLIADITNMGTWSPVCKECWWDDGANGAVGEWFTGRNELPDRTWETRCEVVAAERGKEFAWIVGGTITRWSYALEPTPDGTRLTESWEFLPGGAAMFEQRFGDDAGAQLANREALARAGMPETLAAIKRAAESD